MMHHDDTGARPQGAKPRKLTIARETLRKLGDSTMARAAGGTMYEATSGVCSFISGYVTEKTIDWSADTLSLWGCSTEHSCQTMAATCETCHSQYPCEDTITCTCPGAGCLPPVVIT